MEPDAGALDDVGHRHLRAVDLEGRVTHVGEGRRVGHPARLDGPGHTVDGDLGGLVEVRVEEDGDGDRHVAEDVLPRAAVDPHTLVGDATHDQAGGRRLRDRLAHAGGPRPGPEDAHPEPHDAEVPADGDARIGRHLSAPVLRPGHEELLVLGQHGGHRRGDNVFVGRVAAHPVSLAEADHSGAGGRRGGGPRASSGPVTYIAPGTRYRAPKGDRRQVLGALARGSWEHVEEE